MTTKFRACLAGAIMLALSCAAQTAHALDAKEILDRTQPNVMLGTALNRSVVIEGLVSMWGDDVEASGAMTKKQLKEVLKGLRADHLLSASTAKSAPALLDIISTAVIGPAGVEAHAALKVVGSSTSDLVFTPVAPCRLVDTRLVGGAWTPSTTRSYVGYTATDFAAQGGSATNCSIPANAAALAIEAIALSPPADGWFFLWPANITHPATSTFNYGPALSVISFGTILPVDSANNNGFKADSSQASQLIVDVVGYFETTSLAAANVTQVSSVAVLDSGGYNHVNSPVCPSGRILVSGGCHNSVSGTVVLTDSNINDVGGGPFWYCYFKNNGASSADIIATANCMATPAVK
jgi:hypothetical protein